MKTWLTLLFLVQAVCTPRLDANDIPADLYRASTIPPALIEGSKAVIRYDSRILTVKSRSRASLKVRVLVTVLKPEGRSFGELPLFYDKFVSIDDIDGTLFDAYGKKIRTLGSGDTKDYPVDLGATLAADYRARVATLYHDTYPYTVEYEYEMKYKGYVSWPAWYPELEDAAVEHSRFEVRLSEGIALRFRTTMDIQSAISADGGEKIYRWEVSNLPPFEPEPFGPRTVDQLAVVEIAPELFEIDGYEGDLRTWQSFGLWYAMLAKDRQTLSPAILGDIRACIDGITDEKEKIGRLYRLMQSKTRYVNVTLGVGGWQPYDAMYVCERGYGDCKALSNFMISILQAAGITAYPALIYSGSQPGPIRPEFPSNKFNHVIVCVPTRADTIWLECTSQSLPAGHITPGTENKPALLVTPQGGVLVHTPESAAGENCQVRKASIAIVWTGDAAAEIETGYTGYQRDDLCGLFQEMSPKEKEDWIREKIHILAFAVQRADYSGITSASGDGTMRLTLTLPRYASIAGKRLFFQPNIMNKVTSVPKECKSRKHPVILSYAHLDIDSITYTLPGGFIVEALPDPVVIDKPFARFSSVARKISENRMQYVRSLEIKKAVLPPRQYEEFRLFLRDIVQADKAMAAIVQNE